MTTDALLNHLEYIADREPFGSSVSGPLTDRLIELGYVRRRKSSVRWFPSQEITDLGRVVLAAAKRRNRTRSVQHGDARRGPLYADAASLAPFRGSVVKARVYHGTNTRFDELRFMPGQRRVLGFAHDVQAGGLFFSPSLSTARNYGKHVMEAYIDLRKPLTVPEGPVTPKVARDMAHIWAPFTEAPDPAGGAFRQYGAVNMLNLMKTIEPSDTNPQAPRWPASLGVRRRPLHGHSMGDARRSERRKTDARPGLRRHFGVRT